MIRDYLTLSARDARGRGNSPAKKSPVAKPGHTGGNLRKLLQAGPIDQFDVTRTQVEIAGEQSLDLTSLVGLLGRLVDLDDTAEFLIRTLDGISGQYEVRVVFDAHGPESIDEAPERL